MNTNKTGFMLPAPIQLSAALAERPVHGENVPDQHQRPVLGRAWCHRAPPGTSSTSSLEDPPTPWRVRRRACRCGCDRTAVAPEPEWLACSSRVLGQVLHGRLIHGGPAWEQGQTCHPGRRMTFPRRLLPPRVFPGAREGLSSRRAGHRGRVYLRQMLWTDSHPPPEFPLWSPDPWRIRMGPGEVASLGRS